LLKFPDRYTVHQLHEVYPDENIDVLAEQRLIEHHDKIVFQFPYSYSVFELLDTNEINAGDIISGELDEEGSYTLKNLTENEEFEAIVQNTGLNSIMAPKRTMLI